MSDSGQIIGLDLSLTSTGVAVYDEDTDCITTDVIKTCNKHTDTERYYTILHRISNYFISKNVFFIEGYSFGSFSKSSSMSKLIELGGIIKYDLWLKGVPYIKVPPTTLKKFITGKGNAKKEDIKLAVYKKYGREFKTSDEADAFSLVVLGIKYCKTPSDKFKGITQSEEGCLAKVRGEE